MPAVSETLSAPAPTTGTASDPADHAVVQATRALAVGALLAMVTLGLAWELWLAPTGQRTLAVKVLPMLLPLAGLLKLRLYTYRWVSLLVWLYFIEGAVRANGHGDGATRWLAGAQVLLCLLLFVACVVHVRWRLRHPGAAPADRHLEAKEPTR